MNASARFDNLLFHALLLACLVATTVLGSRYALSLDMTREARNSLSKHSESVLAKLVLPTHIEVYASRSSLLVQAGRDLVERYTRHNPLVSFTHKDIDRDPSIARDLDITGQGAVVVKMGDRRRRSHALTENALTGALESLLLAEDRRALFVSGHGERDASGMANHHYGEFNNRLRERGYAIESTHLLLDTVPTQGGDLMVVASPQRRFEPKERDAITAYLADGGRVLWLLDDDGNGTDTLTQLTGLKRLPGVIVDAASEALDLPRPDFAVVTDYGVHAATRGMDGITLFPRAVALSADTLHPDWTATPLLQSTTRSWNETGDIAGRIAPDSAGEQSGPLTFAWTLSHAQHTGELTVIGDGDFLANSWLGNGVNLAFGERLFDVMSSTTPLLNSATPAQDRVVTLSRPQGLGLGLALFGVLPLLFAALTAASWHRQTH